MAREARDTFRGTSDELADCLLPFAVLKGKKFVRYGDENVKVSKSKLIVEGDEGIESHMDLLTALKKVASEPQLPEIAHGGCDRKNRR